MTDERYQAGMKTRREVLGDKHVDKAIDSSSEFSMAMQELVVKNCWGDIWSREGLDRKTRSLVTVALLTSLRASGELKGHVRGALRNGASKEEIQEVLLHAATYCGMPAGIEAFRAASETIEAWDAGER
ncbi:MAG: carboxymuconolactone decarboxylase family protein [Pseudomonadales bacterium]